MSRQLSHWIHFSCTSSLYNMLLSYQLDIFVIRWKMLRIIYRNQIIFSVLFYQVLTSMFLYVIWSMTYSKSALDLGNLLFFIQDFKYVLISGFVSLIAAFKVWKLSFYIMAAYFAATFILSLQLLIKNFEKTQMLFIFSYLIVSYYVLVIWYREIFEACYNSTFKKTDCQTRHCFHLNCVMEGGEELSGTLTNWNETAAFIRFNDNKQKIKFRKSKISIEFEGKTYEQPFRVVSIKNNEGMGLKFIDEYDKINKGFGWPELYKIINDRGFNPSYVI